MTITAKEVRDNLIALELLHMAAEACLIGGGDIQFEFVFDDDTDGGYSTPMESPVEMANRIFGLNWYETAELLELI